VGGALLLTATLLIVVERAKRIGDRGPGKLRLLDAVLIGLAQTAAVVPGISRSGGTLIAGLALGLNRVTAVRFSFLLAIPVLAGSTVLAAKDISAGDLNGIGPLALGVSFLVSFFASMGSIVWLIRMLKQQRLYWFSGYLVLMAVYVFVAFPPDAKF
jgi:undecaprenyl-diphosphatase